MYQVYNKAAWSLAQCEDAFRRPTDLRNVKFIGPKIVKDIERKLKEALGLEEPGPSAPRKRGRPKRSESANSSASGSVAALNSRRSLAFSIATAASILSMKNISQLYNADASDHPVDFYEKAHIEVAEDLLYKIEFLESSHPMVSLVKQRTKIGTTWNGFLEARYAERYTHSTLPTNWKMPKPNNERPSLANLLAKEQAQRPRANFSLDPSRSMPSQSTNLYSLTTGSGSSQSVAGPSGQHRALDETQPQPALSRSASQKSHSRTTPSTTALTSKIVGKSAAAQLQVNSSHPLARAKTMTNMPPPPTVARPIRRTESAPTIEANRRLSRAIPNLPAVEDTSMDMDGDAGLDLDIPYMTHDRLDLPQFDFIQCDPGAFDIVLVLDNREVKSGQHRDGIARDLQKKGIPVEQRELALGDVCWIAKRRYPRGDEYDEVVLDTVLERKRLDDLVGSIKDGRFHEQKYRLHNTAFRKIFYLVEDFDSARLRGGDFAMSIDTALTSTSIIDGFYVHETTNIHDTIGYYVDLHKQVKAYYEVNSPTQTLYVIPSQLAKRTSYLRLQKVLRHRHPDHCFITSFRHFQTLNSRTGFMTIRETWARMLLTVNGMSPEKVGALIELYPTPRSLYEAFLEAESTEAFDKKAHDRAVEAATSARKRKPKNEIMLAKHLLKDVGIVVNRKVGRALSEKVYFLFMNDEY
ncbi:hypothetical protein FISHEDRAFT_62570 [Fistulina hepatica ATCC 64428]|nr:hypothetical protein FISHEDRAFT_62570 [Fistulina hepatica ATCC 64428]